MKVHDARDGFNDLKPEFLLGKDIPWLWIAAAVVILMLILASRKKKPKIIVQTKKELSEFLAELVRLNEELDTSNIAPKALTTEASAVVRRYIFDRTQTSILECTSQETEYRLLNSIKFSKASATEISKLLQQLENISFSEQGENTSSHAKAKQLIGLCQELLKKLEDKLNEGTK